MNVERLRKLENDILKLTREFEEQTGFAPFGIYTTNDPATSQVKSVNVTIQATHELPFEEEPDAQ